MLPIRPGAVNHRGGRSTKAGSAKQDKRHEELNQNKTGNNRETEKS